MDGVNPDTVWTWNAIGKRPAPGALTPDAPEAKNGFLLNHLISDLLPEREGGYRYSNCDPVTGQAAWYDLRVRIEKAAPTAVSRRNSRASQFAGTLTRPRVWKASMTSLPDSPPPAKEARPGHRPRHLRRLPGLRHLLQGMEHAGLFGAADR